MSVPGCTVSYSMLQAANTSTLAEQLEVAEKLLRLRDARIKVRPLEGVATVLGPSCRVSRFTPFMQRIHRP